jgi:undecaprenyl phosphate-alpha-L-ara4FN deformylase
MPLLVLKIDVDTLRGTLQGVPRLLELLTRYDARATFLYSLGPDHTGRAIKRVFRPGFFSKVQRTSVVKHYGLRTLLYGTLLPGPDIGRRGADVMRASRQAGHETGIHTWDHVAWQDHVRQRDEAWTCAQMARAYGRYQEIFGEPPITHGAAGWQMNPAALRQLDRWAMRYASDGRAQGPHGGPHRVAIDGQPTQCVQLPTTLPTFDELIGIDGMDEQGAAMHLLELTRSQPHDHVFTLHAELEGALLVAQFETLLQGWVKQGYALCSMAHYFASLDPNALPVVPYANGQIAGRSGELLLATMQ